MMTLGAEALSERELPTSAMRRPIEALRPYVDRFWFYAGGRSAHARERVMPTGQMQIIINLGADDTSVYDRNLGWQRVSIPGSFLLGPQSQYSVIDAVWQHRMVGVLFRFGGALPFAGMPCSELHGTQAPLDFIWRSLAVHLRERLILAGTAGAMFDILEDALCSMLVRSQDLHPAGRYAVKQFVQDPNARRISQVADQIGLSHARFIDVFRSQVGLTPKVFCRVRRFQNALKLSREPTPVHWGDLAQSCGYYDQAHFIHEFRALSGITPTAYAAQVTSHANHVIFAD